MALVDFSTVLPGRMNDVPRCDNATLHSAVSRCDWRHSFIYVKRSVFLFDSMYIMDATDMCKTKNINNCK